MMDLLNNPVFICSCIAWFLAQGIKTAICLVREHELRWDLITATGGMPSSHSAFACSLATAIALRDGLNSSLFALAFGFAVVVMTDAVGLRRAAGKQATVVNQIVEELFTGHPISDEKLKELLGHTPTQMVLGALLGIICSAVYMLLVWKG